MGGENDEDAGSPPAHAPTGKDMPPVGAVLGGRFQLEAFLGRGGTGVVFRAFDRVMGEPVAVKLLFPERAADEGWVRRLVREVKVARTIVHPNVRRIFEIGKVDGYWLVTMELGTGSLGERRPEDTNAPPRRPWSERREDARALVDGLAAIHAAGITHRDVTPNNVLRMSDGRLVISDFGLALLDGETTALIAGTPNYVAPEVLTGERPDQCSDVWQLGLVLHEIVFERRPRWDRTSGGQVLAPPLGIADDTPVDDLLRILGSCLSVARARRAKTAVEIAQAFEGATTADLGAGRRALRRRVWLTVAGVLVGVGLIAVRELHLRDRRAVVERVEPAQPAATSAPPPTPAPTRIRLHLESRPSHARVIDVATSEVWGVTPLDVARAPSAAAFTLRFVKIGFGSALVTVSADRDLTETVELRPHHGPAEPTEAPADEPSPQPPDEPEKL